ncbi:uncharacterized protein LOC127536113 isoform X2 [Acanthochromis polyacanthus]|uniref:uncharacterized protein LOC127536113 isoform X2 n=1 Tax=Acanthochromis polyacanthus TaxID=80966 RepID=UPI0022341A09|nr:uncharacterized protein LOC127536113 isoform X2 [Acanthochromis polyacanthus]
MGNVLSITNKVEELATLTRLKEHRECSLMCFTETWLNGHTPDSVVSLNGFTLARTDRNAVGSGKKSGGGLAVYVNERWCNPANVHVKEQLCTRDLEMLMVALRPYYLPREFSHVIVFCVYIPPSAHAGTACERLHSAVPENRAPVPRGKNIEASRRHQDQLFPSQDTELLLQALTTRCEQDVAVLDTDILMQALADHQDPLFPSQDRTLQHHHEVSIDLFSTSTPVKSGAAGAATVGATASAHAAGRVVRVGDLPTIPTILRGHESIPDFDDLLDSTGDYGHTNLLDLLTLSPIHVSSPLPHATPSIAGAPDDLDESVIFVDSYQAHPSPPPTTIPPPSVTAAAPADVTDDDSIVYVESYPGQASTPPPTPPQSITLPPSAADVVDAAVEGVLNLPLQPTTTPPPSIPPTPYNSPTSAAVLTREVNQLKIKRQKTRYLRQARHSKRNERRYRGIKKQLQLLKQTVATLIKAQHITTTSINNLVNALS